MIPEQKSTGTAVIDQSTGNFFKKIETGSLGLEVLIYFQNFLTVYKCFLKGHMYMKIEVNKLIW